MGDTYYEFNFLVDCKTSDVAKKIYQIQDDIQEFGEKKDSLVTEEVAGSFILNVEGTKLRVSGNDSDADADNVGEFFIEMSKHFDLEPFAFRFMRYSGPDSFGDMYVVRNCEYDSILDLFNTTDYHSRPLRSEINPDSEGFQFLKQLLPFLEGRGIPRGVVQLSIKDLEEGLKE